MVARIGILAAMPPEVAKLKEAVSNQQEHKRGEVFTFTTGELAGKPVVFAPGNVGMVFAGSAVTTMINEFGATHVIFTGVAGGLLEGQRIGDIVVGTDVVNYEFDCRQFKYPWDPSYELQLGEIPFVNWRFFAADPAMLASALAAPRAEGVRVSSGRIASGSIFVNTEQKKAMAESVWKPLDFPACCEMENAGVAQICRAYNTPYLSLRALSDLITGDANADFNAFCAQAADNTFPLVMSVVESIAVSD